MGFLISGRMPLPLWMMSSCGEDGVEFVDEGGELVTKELVGFAEAAALGEGGIVEVVGFDGDAGGDLVAHELQPGELVGGEGCACFGFVHEPFVEAFVDGFGKWFERGLLFEGVADEGDEVGEAAGLGAALDAFGGGGGGGLPEDVFAPLGVFLDQFGFEFLERFFGEALFVGAVVEDLQGGDFGLVLLDVGAEVF